MMDVKLTGPEYTELVDDLWKWLKANDCSISYKFGSGGHRVAVLTTSAEALSDVIHPDMDVALQATVKNLNLYKQGNEVSVGN